MPAADADPLVFLRGLDLTWLDLVLPEGTIAELRALAAHAPRGGLAAVVSGPPGVGKTVVVRALAEQLRLDTWLVDCRLLVELRDESAAWRAHLARRDIERLAAIPVAGAEIERTLDRVVEEADDAEPDTARLLAALGASS
jgi:type II secretory pathway predicted ATPase ExeA